MAVVQRTVTKNQDPPFRPLFRQAVMVLSLTFAAFALAACADDDRDDPVPTAVLPAVTELPPGIATSPDASTAAASPAVEDTPSVP